MKGYHWVFLALLFISTVLPGYLVIWPGTQVCGIDLGGLKVEQAAHALTKALSWESRTFRLVGAGGDSQSCLWSSTGIFPDADSTIKSLRRPLWFIWKRQHPLFVKTDQKRISLWLEAVAFRFDRAPSNAFYTFSKDDKVEVFESTQGILINQDMLLERIFKEGKWKLIPDTVVLPLIYVKPDVATEDLKSCLPFELVSHHSTYYQDGSDRAHNIALASTCLDGCTVAPGQVLSFNEATGPRSKEKGYKKAGVFVGFAVVDDYGGGVCQVSTTLYVALLKADFGIVERYNHGMPVSYVPLGLDATVAYDVLDLKMKNRTPAPCIVKTSTQDGCLTVKVFGKKNQDLDIEIESEVTKEIPVQCKGEGDGSKDHEPNGGSSLTLRSGFMVETWRKYMSKGSVVKAELLNSSWYPPERPKPTS